MPRSTLGMAALRSRDAVDEVRRLGAVASRHIMPTSLFAANTCYGSYLGRDTCAAYTVVSPPCIFATHATRALRQPSGEFHENHCCFRRRGCARWRTIGCTCTGAGYAHIRVTDRERCLRHLFACRAMPDFCCRLRAHQCWRRNRRSRHGWLRSPHH